VKVLLNTQRQKLGKRKKGLTKAITSKNGKLQRVGRKDMAQIQYMWGGKRKRWCKKKEEGANIQGSKGAGNMGGGRACRGGKSGGEMRKERRKKK